MEEKLQKFIDIMRDAGERGASDIHISPMCVIMYRIDGELVPVSEHEITPEEIEDIIEVLADDNKKQELQQNGQVDIAYSVSGLSRVRINVFKQRGTHAMSVHMLPFDIPSAKELKFPEAVTQLTELNKGLVLITGASGSGKSTTLAALINMISNNYSKNIITLEQPIEYLHSHGRSMVNQREIGYDAPNYATALSAALRQDPDVIVVGELNDLDTIMMAIAAAETGHLVFSTLRTSDVRSTIERLYKIFPPHQQQQIRVQLADVLKAVVTQQLLPKQTGGRVAAYEIMITEHAIRNAIRQENTEQIELLMHNSKKKSMQLMDDAIFDLYMKSYISSSTAISYARDPESMSVKVKI